MLILEELVDQTFYRDLIVVTLIQWILIVIGIQF